MAVKPITNNQSVNKSSIDRSSQISTKNLKNKPGNRKTSIIPGKNIGKNYSITLKDVDSSILFYVKNVLRPSIREANELIQVPIMYANQERWASARKRGVLRDKNGSIIFPLMVFKRTNVARSSTILQNYEHDVKREHISVTRNRIWSKKNRYDRFSVQTGIKPLYESIVTGMPNFVDITYEFIVWTNYIEQMNSMIEIFIEHDRVYWGDSTDYKFLSIIDSISDASEMDVAGERFIKSTFEVVTKAYLLPEETNSIVTNKISQLQKKLTPNRVNFGLEIDVGNI